MSSISENQKTEMQTATRSTAFALSDDLKHTRDVLSKEMPSQGDIRRLSTLLRRILLDGDLRKVAGPRTEKVTILAPQLKPFHQHHEREPSHLFIGGAIKFPGGSFSNVRMATNPMEGGHLIRPDELVELNIEQFIAQRVLYYKTRWVTRKSVIKYVVIVAHAAHSADPAKDVDFAFIDDLKYRVAIQPNENGFPTIDFTDFDKEQTDSYLRYDRNRIDLALAMLHSTASYLVASPSIVELERLIDIERDSLC
jgi:hypothetical protein